MVTAELALAVPTLLVVLMVCLAAVQAAAATVRCTDAAAVAARLTTRGEARSTVLAQVRPVAAAARLTVTRAGGFVEVTVTERLRLPIVGGLLPGLTVSSRLSVPDEAAGSGPIAPGPLAPGWSSG